MSETIVVRYNKANTLSLPYFNKDGSQSYMEFKPGRNDVNREAFESIFESMAEQENGENKIAHYGKHLKVEKDVVKDEETGKEDYSAMNVGDFCTLIESTADIATVEGYQAFEEAGKKRKGVLDTITKHLLILNTPPDE